jgi:hypothetical protein
VVTQTTEYNQTPADVPEKDPVNRSIAIGIACTLLFHLMLLLLSPQFAFNRFAGVHSGINVVHPKQGKTFDFQLDPGQPEEKKDPFRFVETNPDAPENTPDKTPNFSNRNQQSAQPEPAKEKDLENRPSLKGQDQIKNDTAIVTGDMSKPQQGAAAAPEVLKNDKDQQQKEEKARAEQTPLSGFEKREGLSEDGIASNISTAKSPSTQAQQLVEGNRDAKDTEGGMVAVNQVTKAQPKARPRLTAARPTILNNRITGVSNMGILGMDARWSEYGEYMQELIEIVQTQWYRILEESRVSPPRGSHVIVTFKINSKGETEIVKVEDADSGKQGVFSCENAIQARQPYRKWTEQMISVLGDEQTITFGFYYQ